MSITANPDTLVSTQSLLKTVLQRLFLAIPDAYISPRLWAQHYSLLESSLTDDLIQRGPGNDRHLEHNLRELRESTMRTLFHVKRRNEALAFREPPARISAKLSAAVSNVKVTNILHLLLYLTATHQIRASCSIR